MATVNKYASDVVFTLGNWFRTFNASIYKWALLGVERVILMWRSRVTTTVIIAGLFLQSGFLALIGRTSIYDERFHLTIIRYFGTRGSPFSWQSDDLLGVGDVSRSAYLYHWLMSFVYRLMRAMGFGDFAVWMSIRLLSVMIASSAAIFVYLALRELGAGRGVVNVALLLMSTTPLLVYVNSIVNWDGFTNTLVAIVIWISLKMYNAQRFEPTLWCAGIIVVVAVALSKSELVILMLPMVLIVSVRQLRGFGRGSMAEVRSWLNSRTSVVAYRLGLLAAAVAAIALFIERYIINLVRFGSPLPGCSTLHPTEICMTWGPYGRNVYLDAAFPDMEATLESFITYVFSTWIPALALNANLMGVITVEEVPVQATGTNVANWVVWYAIPLGVTILIAGLCLVKVKRGTWMILLSSAVMMAGILSLNFRDFNTMGIPVLAVQARYVLPVLPFIFGIFAIVLWQMLKRFSEAGKALASALLVGTIIAASQGGGFLGFMAVSDAQWWITEVVSLDTSERIADATRTIMRANEWIPNPRILPRGP